MNSKLRNIAEFFVGRNENKYTRYAFVENALKQLPRGAKILDAGAGTLKYKELCKHLNYVSQDFCQYDGKGDGRGLQNGEWHTGDNKKDKIDIVSDIVDIPVPDNEFDAVLCSEVLEHLPEPDKAIKEFGRILNHGGVLILTAPFCSLTHFAPYHYCTGFNIYWYQKILGKYGFEIETVERNGNYFSFVWQEVLRIPQMCNKYVKKNDVVTTVLAALLAARLKKYKSKNGSEELACFGYHIIAVKIGASNENS
jgi:ubiquinone/menaquinone biosynthesis C-methylase UbiE